MPAVMTTASWFRAETTSGTVPPTVVWLVTSLAPGAARTAATAWLADWACSSRCCVPAWRDPQEDDGGRYGRYGHSADRGLHDRGQPAGRRPGAAVLYALLAVLAWPGGREERPARSVADGSPLGRCAKLPWLLLIQPVVPSARSRPPYPAPGRQTWMIPSLIRVRNTGWGAVAGPRATLPPATRKVLPCHGQVRQPSW